MSAKVSFRITTYYKRPRGEAGLTQVGSRRVDTGQAIGWILGELPEDSWEMRFEGDDVRGAPRKTTIVIDWGKVPAEIAEGLS